MKNLLEKIQLEYQKNKTKDENLDYTKFLETKILELEKGQFAIDSSQVIRRYPDMIKENDDKPAEIND